MSDPEQRAAPLDPAPLDPARPVVDGRDLSPQERRADLEDLRSDLGDTVEELVHRVDVPARVRERRDEVTADARARLARAREWLEQRPALVAAVLAGVPVVLLLVRRARRGPGR